MTQTIFTRPLLTLFSLLFLSVAVTAQTTAFTYQGRLTDNMAGASGPFDMRFELYDALTGGAQVGSLEVLGVSVSNGLFTVELDFGAFTGALTGENRYLEISVKRSGEGYVTLAPRQRITSAPYAIRSLKSGTADNASNAANLGGVEAARYIQRDIDGNASVSGNFSVGGTLSSNIISSQTQYNLGGFRILFAPGTNTFAGVGAGQDNVGGTLNSFFGRDAGRFNSGGHQNTFFGGRAGYLNGDGQLNTFVGYEAGRDNVGSSNTFVGTFAGTSSAFGSKNTLIGYLAAINTINNLTYATAIGAEAVVSTSNTIALGRGGGQDTVQVPGKIGIGTPNPTFVVETLIGADNYSYVHTDGTRILGTYTNSFLNSGMIGTISLHPFQIFTSNAGPVATFTAGGSASGRVGIGTTSPGDRLHVAGDIRVGTGTTGCVKDADGTAIAGACSSDGRLKRDISAFPRVLDKISMLRPVHFYWDEKQQSGKVFGKSLSFGLIAQDVEKVLPDLVTEDEGGFKAVRYNKLPLLTLQAVKELKEENDLLRKRLQEHEAKFEQQSIQLNALRQLVCAQNAQSKICREEK